MLNRESPFLAMPREKWVASNDLAFAIRDRFPVSPGHTLVVPRRLIAGWFDATPEEQVAIFQLVNEVRAGLEEELAPDGYNVGMNIGAAAGQTVFHLHVHVIPRFDGDMLDPRGGVRHVIPWKGNYNVARERALVVGHDDPFLEHLRPLIAGADTIDVVAAFVQDSGLEILEGRLHSALERGARVRLLCGDYLHITQEAALRRLLDFQNATSAEHGERQLEGTFRARVVETGRWAKSFHPKSWQFHRTGGGVAFVGSSNISRLALTSGVEWNLRVDEMRDPDGFAEAAAAFETHWVRGVELSEAWVDAYATQVRERPALPAQLFGEFEAEPLAAPPQPHQLQERALAALRVARAEGRQRALTVLATGLGKTWLSAFDVRQFTEEIGVLPRVLFLAHRSEILTQAARTYRRMFPEAKFGWVAGDARDFEGDVVFASVQKLSRSEHLAALEPDAFDYVVVDEVHHAAADSYVRIIERLKPQFMLGLTATPERTDGADILTLFDDYLAEEIGIAEGIEASWLVPFRYFGVKDTVDFTPIPWRGGKFDHATLSAAVQTEARMERLAEVLLEHDGARTLVFCCGIAHALFVRNWLADRGHRAAAIVSNHPDGDDRQMSLDRLGAGELEFVCAVDILNEGVDIPTIDRVVMLRPTESSVVFLQQLGRGLRIADGKQALTVIDFVGNHRLFLERLRWLLSLGAGDDSVSLQRFLDKEEATLPNGCSVELEFEAKELLRLLLPKSSRTAIVRAYRELRDARGMRPSIGELFRIGHDPRTVRGKYGSWFAFVWDEGDLALDAAAFETVSGWLREVEVTPMVKCFKAVTLKVILEHGRLSDGMELDEIARRSYELIVRSPELFDDIRGVRALGDARSVSAEVWARYWRVNPIAAWENSAFAEVVDERLRFRTGALDAESEAVAHETTRELVDYRLAQYRARKRERFYAHVLRNPSDKPILMFGNRGERASIPEGEVAVEVDGDAWTFRFVKVAVNVARAPGTTENMLPELLYGWFGLEAGQKGTRHRVRFERAGDRWFARPIGVPEMTAAEQAVSELLIDGPYEVALAQHARAIVVAAQIENDLTGWLTARFPALSERERDTFVARLSEQ